MPKAGQLLPNKQVLDSPVIVEDLEAVDVKDSDDGSCAVSQRVVLYLYHVV